MKWARTNPSRGAGKVSRLGPMFASAVVLRRANAAPPACQATWGLWRYNETGDSSRAGRCRCSPNSAFLRSAACGCRWHLALSAETWVDSKGRRIWGRKKLLFNVGGRDARVTSLVALRTSPSTSRPTPSTPTANASCPPKGRQAHAARRLRALAARKVPPRSRANRRSARCPLASESASPGSPSGPVSDERSALHPMLLPEPLSHFDDHCELALRNFSGLSANVANPQSGFSRTRSAPRKDTARLVLANTSSNGSTRGTFWFTTPTPMRFSGGIAARTSNSPARGVASSRKSVPTRARESRPRSGR